MSFPIENYSLLSAQAFELLRERLATHTSVKHGLDWFLGMTPPVAPADCIAQDEFSHNVPFHHPDGFWVVYECT